MHTCSSRPVCPIEESELCHFPVIIIIMSRTRSGSVALVSGVILCLKMKMHPRQYFCNLLSAETTKYGSPRNLLQKSELSLLGCSVKRCSFGTRCLFPAPGHPLLFLCRSDAYCFKSALAPQRIVSLALPPSLSPSFAWVGIPKY